LPSVSWIRCHRVLPDNSVLQPIVHWPLEITLAGCQKLEMDPGRCYEYLKGVVQNSDSGLSGINTCLNNSGDSCIFYEVKYQMMQLLDLYTVIVKGSWSAICHYQQCPPYCLGSPISLNNNSSSDEKIVE
jgi:hypothetical protein